MKDKFKKTDNIDLDRDEAKKLHMVSDDNRWLINSLIYLIILIAEFALVAQIINSSPNSVTFIVALFGLLVVLSSMLVVTVFYIRWTRKSSIQKAKEKYPNLSIIGVILRKRQRSMIFVTINLFLAFSLLLTYANFIGYAVSNFALLIIFFLLLLSVARVQLLEYRIRKGYYGRNEYEAREIIQFVIDHSKNIDFTDAGRPKPLLSNADLEQIKNRLQEGLNYGTS